MVVDALETRLKSGSKMDKKQKDEIETSLKWVRRRNDRKSVVLSVWEPWNKYSMNHKGLANKYGMQTAVCGEG